MFQFLLKVSLGFFLGWFLIGGERGVASDSFLPSSLNQAEEIQEVVIYPQLGDSVLSGVGDIEQDLSQPEGPVFADVYFDERRQFIDARLKGIFLQTVVLLNQEPDWNLQIEGHCDPRGTSAYNLTRADFHLATLTRYLQMLGVPSHQISTMNYGQDPVSCRADSERCQEDNLRAQHIFSNLAIRHTQRGCLTRLRLVAGYDWHRALQFTQYLPNLQRIQVASPTSVF